jgi:tetratricopeptide (TPR) repeat protein
VALVLVVPAGAAALQQRVPIAFERAATQLSALVRRLAAAGDGRLVDAEVGGHLLVFPQAQLAVGFTLRLQLAAMEEAWPPTLAVRPEAAELRDGDRVWFRGLRLAMGVHVGRPDLSADRWTGPAVDQVARLTALAAGGQTLLDDAAWRAMVGNPGVPFVLRDLGHHAFPGVSGQRRVLQVLPSRLDGRPLPPLATPDRLQTNLAAPSGPLLGRERDAAAVLELMEWGFRTVTVHGPRGVGAGALAQRVAWAARDRFASGGVWSIPVGSMAASTGETAFDLLIAETCHALGVALPSARSDADAVSQLGWVFSGRGRTLLLLDGVVSDGEREVVRDAIQQWMRVAPELCVLLLGSRRWGLPSEVTYTVEPLPMQGPGSAEALWVEAARGLGVGLDPAQIPGLATRFGGAPGAIRLAAGALARSSAEDVLAAPGTAGQVAWAATSEDERELLWSAACFSGPFRAAWLAGLTRAPVMDGVRMAADLALRGWWTFAPCSADPSPERYRWTAEGRAAVAMAADPDATARQERFLSSMVDRAERIVPRVFGVEGLESVAALVSLRPSLSLAARHEGGGDALARAGRAALVLLAIDETRGPFGATRRVVEHVVRRFDAALDADPIQHGRLLTALAEAAWQRGWAHRFAADLARAADMAARWEDPEGLLFAQLGLAIVALELGETPDIDGIAAIAAGFEALAAPRRAAMALAVAGRAAFAAGRLDLAEAHGRRAVEITRRLGVRRDEARYLADLARTLWRTGRHGLARACFLEVLRVHLESGDRRREAHAASSLADLDLLEGRLDEAEAQYQHAVSIARALGEWRIESHAVASLGWVALERGDADAARGPLLRAVAVERDQGDALREGAMVCRLGVANHLAGRRASARACYQRAEQQLSTAQGSADWLVCLGWMAALAAEEGEYGDARRLEARVRSLVSSGDGGPEAHFVALIGAAVSLFESDADPEGEARRVAVSEARARCAEARAAGVATAPSARLAVRWVEQLVAARD